MTPYAQILVLFYNLVYFIQVNRDKTISIVASKPISIRWIRNGSRPDWKIMYSIELQTIFYNYNENIHK